MVFLSGIIPARAGFTTRTPKATAPGPDHPRSRGVYPLRGSRQMLVLGSSPLARGLRYHARVRVHGCGIIPARAGFTAGSRSWSADRRDHPRSRGVYVPRDIPVAAIQGSSPLARGLPEDRRRGPGRRRIIPARAGFTRDHVSARALTEDHPRSRGVYAAIVRITGIAPGSSPLARGLQPRNHQGPHRPGIIPARAGFTS